MAEAQILFIGTSKKKEIRSGGAVTWHWNSNDKTKWKKLKSPAADSQKKIKYDKKTKNKVGKQTDWISTPSGGVTICGTHIPHTATRFVDGVSVTVEVRYKLRGYTIYQKTSALKKDKKMLKKVYTKAKPYQYRLQYKSKKDVEAAYSQYVDGTDYIYFADHYFVGGVEYQQDAWLPHPTDVSFSFSDVRRNFESNANNNESRDNKGKYVMKNVRANVLTIDLVWTGLAEDEGQDLIDSLNPDKDHPYLIVQYINPVTGTYRNGTFYADKRDVTRYPNGVFKEIKVTLTEV